MQTNKLRKIVSARSQSAILAGGYGIRPYNLNITTSFCYQENQNLQQIHLGEIQFMLQATPQILDDLDSYLPTQKDTTKIAQFFALLADQTRVRMLSALAIAPLCVTDLARVLGLNQTTVSHQLRLLRDVGVVETNRKGKIIQYKIANPKINEILLVGVEYLGY